MRKIWLRLNFEKRNCIGVSIENGMMIVSVNIGIDIIGYIDIEMRIEIVIGKEIDIGVEIEMMSEDIDISDIIVMKMMKNVDGVSGSEVIF